MIDETSDGIVFDFDPDDGIVELFIGPLSNAAQLGVMPQVLIDSSNRKVYMMDGAVFQMQGNPAQSFYRRSGPDDAEWGDPMEALTVGKSVGGPRFEAIVHEGEGFNNVRIGEVYVRLHGDSTMEGAKGSMHFAVRQADGDVRDVLVLTEDGEIVDGDDNPIGSGEQGPRGPHGPRGPVGMQGTRGERGMRGQKGEDGVDLTRQVERLERRDKINRRRIKKLEREHD